MGERARGAKPYVNLGQGEVPLTVLSMEMTVHNTFFRINHANVLSLPDFLTAIGTSHRFS